MSNSELMLDVGQANELKLAFRRAGYTNDEIKQLCEGTFLADVRDALRGFSNIRPIEHVIDCDADAKIPKGLNWKVKEHQKGGRWRWNPDELFLYSSPRQKDGRDIHGSELRKELAGKPVLNVNVLDYLLEHPELIPNSWKNHQVYFWGTIYTTPGRSFNVSCLYWSGCDWYRSSRTIWIPWNPEHLAVLRTS